MKNAVILLADGFEEIEALSPADYLRRAGVNVILAAIGKDECTVTGSHKISVNADMTLSDYLEQMRDLPDAVVVPGGMPGAANIASCEAAVGLIQKMTDKKHLVAAICAAPAVVLSKTSALKNRLWTCYPGMESNAGEYASMYKEGLAFVNEENLLVTARGPGAAEQFSMELVRILSGESSAEKIRTGSCQR